MKKSKVVKETREEKPEERTFFLFQGAFFTESGKKHYLYREIPDITFFMKEQNENLTDEYIGFLRKWPLARPLLKAWPVQPGAIISSIKTADDFVSISKSKYEGRIKDERVRLLWTAEYQNALDMQSINSMNKEDAQKNDVLEKIKPLHLVYNSFRTQKQRQMFLVGVISMVVSGTREVE